MQINQKEHPLSFTQKKYKLQSIQKVSIVQSLQTFISVFLYQKATFYRAQNEAYIKGVTCKLLNYRLLAMIFV